MRRPLLAAALLWLGLASGLAAQEPLRVSPPVIKYGKWVALGSSIIFGLLSQGEHASADRAFGQLQDYCLDDQSRCNVGANGHYLDPVSEGYYQTSLTHDRRAGRWLVSGELLFLGAAAGFIWELTRPASLPPNIPLAPLIEQDGDRLRVGGTIRF